MNTDKVLIIDDRPDSARMLAEHFRKKFNCEVTIVFSVDDAEEHLRKEVFQVIVSDYEMPGRDGRELVKVLEDLVIESVLLFYTGKDQPSRFWESLGYPCVAVLKPDYNRVLSLAHSFLTER